MVLSLEQADVTDYPRKLLGTMNIYLGHSVKIIPFLMFKGRSRKFNTLVLIPRKEGNEEEIRRLMEGYQPLAIIFTKHINT